MSSKNVEPVFRTVSLEKLKNLKRKTSYIDYTDMIRSGLHGHEVDRVKKRLLLTDVPSHQGEVFMQDELLNFLSKDIKEAEASVARKTEFVEFCKGKRDEAKQVYLDAKRKLEEAEKRLNEAEAEIAKAEVSQMRSVIEQKEITDSFESARKKRNSMDEIVLVHRSANIGKLSEHANGKVFMTEVDAKYLNGVFTPDQVFDSTLSQGLIENLPYNFSMLDDPDELKSIIQFVEMAMYFYLMGEDKVAMLYASKNISTALKKEGL